MSCWPSHGDGSSDATHSFVDGNGVRPAVARVPDDARCTFRRARGMSSLDSPVHGRHVEGPTKVWGIRSRLALGFRGTSSKTLGASGSDSEFLVNGVVPYLLRILPVRHAAVLDGVLRFVWPTPRGTPPSAQRRLRSLPCTCALSCSMGFYTVSSPCLLYASSPL